MPSTVKADLGQLEQVIVNLAVNARDAMSQGGRLTIETSHRVLDDTAARWHGFVQPGSYVLLTVSDTGIGMDRATQARIFEPFFTTKEPGKGTGMGLAVVYGIVKQNNGHIWVYSEPGQGTTFKIYFPQIVAPVEIGKSANTLVTYPEGSETILVVEDDKEVLDAVCDLLQMQGYVVLKAQQGDEAFHICAQHQGPIHLLLTDVVLPQMSGQELSQRLLLLYPQIKVLYMTGYTIDTILHHGLINQGMHCIQKPFSMHDLFHKLRELLESR
jgi:CheY-like chemotaxis protein